jgi:DNA repair exonuclease SbcCD ATPase subunit
MKLLRLGTDGFGGLKGYFTFDPRRLAIVVDDNERGKSTLLAAISAALYGLEDDRRSHRPMTPLERWRPWGGGEYGVEAEVECAGETYLIKRDFHRGTVEVKNSSHQDVTAEFREGKDGYPVGLKLLGLDVEEFERCAFVRQGELMQVVPADEPERRGPTLRARIEAAADSRLGDTMASEALALLEGALRRYDCHELETTVTIDTAIQRLESKRLMLETESKTLEHDLSSIAGPLEELSDLVMDERATRETLAGLDGERRAGLAEEARRQLEEHHRHRAELSALRREADELAAAAALPAEAESQLRDTVARLEVARGKVSEWETRRQEQITRQRSLLDEERQSLKVFEPGTAADADRCVTLAAEMRRVVGEDERVRDEIFSLRESLATGGHDPERLQWLQHRLGPLTEADHGLLRRHAELALTHQTEVADLENMRTTSSETLREIDAQRNRWSLPGWFLLALGISGIVAGGTVVAIQGLPVLSTTFFVVGALMLGTGVALVVLGRQLREDEREESLRALSESQRRLGGLKQQRAETETGLEALARAHGYRDHVELLREWNEFARLRGESAPALHAQQQLGALEDRRRRVQDESTALLTRFGDIPATPENLEQVAVHLRRLDTLRQQIAGLEKSWPWIDEQMRVDEAEAAGLQERAVRILSSAGITHDPQRSWEEHARDLATRLKGKGRHVTLTEELIPRAAQRLMSDERVAELEAQLALAGGTETPGPRRTAVEREDETRRLMAHIDQVQKRRGDLRVRVEETLRRYHAEHPEKSIQIARIEQSLARARRFQGAVEIARQTIQSVATESRRRWADHLNQRVAEVMSGIGAGIEQIRFGEDLDFSVRLAGGQTLARGKADLQLSAGLRDQIYLAVRLAISEFLSRGQDALPLLLDDVFATSDDARARRGIKLLIEQLAGTHQILLMTCHRQRIQRFAELEPELYAARVQLLDTRGLASAR